MKQVPFKLLLTSAAILFCFTAAGQNLDPVTPFRSVGFQTGYGFGENTDTKYRPLYFTADLAYQLNKKNAGKKKFLTWYLEPQFNLAFTERPHDYEAGINIGLRNNIKVSDRFYFYQLIGSGPHYFSATIERQAPGFLFSDNFAAGIYNRISEKKSLFLNLQFRFRHMSNASLKKPNGGINTFNVLVGLLKIKAGKVG